MFINFPEVSGVVIENFDQAKLPQMMRIRQIYDATYIRDTRQHIIERMQSLPDQEFYNGKRICITCGSRGIPQLALILRTICDQLKLWGAEPFVIPAMGSHGGGTAQGQTDVLLNLGVTEESIQVPINSCMEVVQYAQLSNGIPLYCDKLAVQADGIIILNKVKPHTDFRGKHESGLAKMIAIGIAKHTGAAKFHAMGFSDFAERIPEAAELFLQTMPHVIGVGIVQNAYDSICDLEIVQKEMLMETDAHLLEIAKQKIALFKFDTLDVLIIDEIGKEISGFGHDPNITGRANGYEPGFSDILKLNKLFIRRLTKQTHHNGAGISEADITTRQCLLDIDWGLTWTNIITSTEIQGGKIPMYTNNDLDALRIILITCNSPSPEQVRLARIRNTLHMHEIEISKYLCDQISGHPEIELLEGPYTWKFDDNNNLLDI